MLMLDDLINKVEINYKLGNYKSANYNLETYIKLANQRNRVHVMKLNNLLYDIKIYNLEYNVKGKASKHLSQLIDNIKEVVQWEV